MKIPFSVLVLLLSLALLQIGRSQNITYARATSITVTLQNAGPVDVLFSGEANSYTTSSSTGTADEQLFISVDGGALALVSNANDWVNITNGDQFSFSTTYQTGTLTAGNHTFSFTTGNTTIDYPSILAVAPNDPGTALSNAVTQMTAAYQAADSALQTAMQDQINAVNTALTNSINTLTGQVSTLTTQVAALQSSSSSGATQQQVTSDEAAIAALQSEAAAQQSQLQALGALGQQSSDGNLQSEVTALSTRVNTLTSSPTSKSNLNTYLLYGAAAAGAGGLGLGLYSFFNQSSGDSTDSSSSIPIFDSAPTDDSDSYGQEHVFTPSTR